MVNIQRSRLENHIFTDPISNKKILDITRADIIDFRSRLVSQKGDSTANKTIGVLKTIFKEALFREDINRDPTIGIGKIKYDKKVTGILSPTELKAIFPTDRLGPWKDKLDYSCFLLTASTGMRRGEIFALKWKHIYFFQKFITIEEAWKGRHEIGLPKWNRKRVVPIPQITLTKLKELYKESTGNKPDDFIFSNEEGNVFRETWWAKRFKRAMDNAGIDYKTRNLKPHSFRHTINTILRDEGLDTAKIRETLGWTQESTQENYTHWQIEHLRERANIIENLLG